MSRNNEIKAGDRVMLLGWQGDCEGHPMTPGMAILVGKTMSVLYMEKRGKPLEHLPPCPILDNGYSWPLSRVQKVQ